MKYLGYEIRPCMLTTPAGVQSGWEICDGGRRRAVACSRDFCKHVIDAKTKTGEWPDLRNSKGDTPNG